MLGNTRQRVTGFVLPVGNGAVGKTSVAQVLNHLRPGVTNYEEILARITKTKNLEFEFVTVNINIDGLEYAVVIQLLVPPGQKATEGDPTGRSFEDVIDIYRFHFRLVDVVLLTYDITIRESFNELDYWINAVHELCYESTQVVVLGTHLDKSEAREVSPEEASMAVEYVKRRFTEHDALWRGSVTSIEVSNLEGHNMEALKTLLAKNILRSRGQLPAGSEEWDEGSEVV